MESTTKEIGCGLDSSGVVGLEGGSCGRSNDPSREREKKLSYI